MADEVQLKKSGKYVIKIRVRGSKKYIKGEAQKSFFINYWHLTARDKINGVPDWIYN